MTETTDAPAAKPDTAHAMDSKGRLITVKRLNALQYYRLSKALGGASAANPATMELAIMVCAVTRLDAEDIAFPATERDIEFLIQKLDFHGISAIGEALKKLDADSDAEVEASKN